MSSAASAPAIVYVGASTVEKRPGTRDGVGLRKCLRKATPEQPIDASGSITRTSTEKGKGVVELEEVPEWGYTLQELCEVEDRAGADRYFTSIMTWLKAVDSEDPLAEGALHPTLPKQVYEYSSKELMNRVDMLVVWVQLEQEVGVMCSNLNEARNDRARLEGDVLSLIEAAVFLEVELKAERPKPMTAYKASRGFELGLEKMGRVPMIAIEQDLFTECPNDANVEMDLNQTFDDSTLPKK
ncbi:hypothetical protein B296_00040153 [Ensete ventricosum]|uniref:Uncharacterized protein n=1 Tax=Ensete ventricosum TaxID=4639 RepID=A0A426ZRF4_ENSVE|nr:hypothetical protein B296_00040153 [Ensete ventricosum]